MSALNMNCTGLSRKLATFQAYALEEERNEEVWQAVDTLYLRNRLPGGLNEPVSGVCLAQGYVRDLLDDVLL